MLILHILIDRNVNACSVCVSFRILCKVSHRRGRDVCIPVVSLVEYRTMYLFLNDYGQTEREYSRTFSVATMLIILVAAFSQVLYVFMVWYLVHRSIEFEIYAV